MKSKRAAPLHSDLADRTPAEVAAIYSDGNRGDQIVLKNTSRFLHFHQIAAGSELKYAPASSDLLGTITRTRLTAIVPVKGAQSELRRPKLPTLGDHLKAATYDKSRGGKDAGQRAPDGGVTRDPEAGQHRAS
jgi:hypothetical protein